MPAGRLVICISLISKYLLYRSSGIQIYESQNDPGTDFDHQYCQLNHNTKCYVPSFFDNSRDDDFQCLTTLTVKKYLLVEVPAWTYPGTAWGHFHLPVMLHERRGAELCFIAGAPLVFTFFCKLRAVAFCRVWVCVCLMLCSVIVLTMHLKASYPCGAIFA